MNESSRRRLEDLAAIALIACCVLLMVATFAWVEYRKCSNTWGRTPIEWRWTALDGCEVRTPQGWRPSFVLLIREGR